MDAFLSGVVLLARFDVVLALLVGSVGGVLIGAIPGVGPAVAIAILLPAPFSLDPLVGLTTLLGIYGSSMFGGALPAILISTPGTAVNALTIYDGHPMTQRGEALRALGLAYGASFVDGILSIVALILLAPLLAKVAPMFGSREIFLAALLGIVLVILAHRGQTLGPGLIQNRLDFVYALYTAMIALNVIVVLFMLVASNWVMQIIRVPSRFLGMTILTLGFVGVHSLRNSTTDCLIAAVFGMLGLILKRQNLPVVPIVLGMVLGGIMEVKLRSAMARVKTPLEFVDRPIEALLAVAILALIVLHVWGMIRERRLREPEFSHDHDIHDSQARRPRTVPVPPVP